ncbi:ASKHA domain-containing protein [Aurantimonas sp. C2-6-R+9]|uniref:ASKHA domain-containing protein n=1 Tax=unclassified Aurantimonas TaxID=2638230 RepID=UPI002E19B3AD|nr:MULTISPECIES: ASKHA domain-containing protein [unclassified Aurantimonas]MEC5290756.1 ASKHA domain-containing protein [Aurantimonas sp. C2-3-R2]MEC5380772.1 ASKHA domain-containing protein [Aurantimonas sp. C2-6-R+9]MEC5411821.1 ASKHA domain-containing protein [Aurantimonas sp. C2-4-R8]
MTQQDPLVLFMPSGQRGRFAKGTLVIEAARSLGVYVDSVCGGRGICGRCQIEVAEGIFAKHKITSAADHLSAWSAKEERYAAKRGLKPGRRLSCSTTIEGDLVIDLPSDMAVNAAVVRKAVDTREFPRDPAIRLLYVEVVEPDMHAPLGDLDRIFVALEKDWGISAPIVDPGILPHVQKTLRDGAWKVTCAIAQDRDDERPRLMGLYSGLKNEAYGIAVDIGSTTIALHLSSLLSGATIASAGTPNPQIRFGEDLMSRVSYVMMNPGGRPEMTKAVREAIQRLVEEVATETNVDTADIMDCVFVGNPIMHHLFLGIDPTELGQAPFALAVSGALAVPASDLDLSLHPAARAYLLPCIAGHVGADAAAVTLSEGPHRQDETMLVVDVGTNAEIVLGNRQRLLAASSPTGPAFEGAEISSGQRAAPGAIERVRIDPETLEPRFKIIGVDGWSDDPGFAAAAQSTGVTGICGSGIIEVIAEMFLAGIITEDGIIDGSLAARSSRIVPEGRTFAYVLHATSARTISILQTDVRAIQLAKAALYAGIKLLIDKFGAAGESDTIDRIALAGAFGSFIEPKYAMVLGLVPDCNVEKCGSVGNAAGAGARMALLNRSYRREIEAVVKRIQKVETALEPAFQDHFVAAMAFPNKRDAYPELVKVQRLPNRDAEGRPIRRSGEAEGDAPRRRRGGRPPR